MRRGPEWGSLVQGVVRALAGELGSLGQGIEGVVEGSLPVGGVSSSAALQVVVLLALLEILDVHRLQAPGR